MAKTYQLGEQWLFEGKSCQGPAKGRKIMGFGLKYAPINRVYIYGWTDGEPNHRWYRVDHGSVKITIK